MELMKAVDTYIPQPVRQVDKLSLRKEMQRLLHEGMDAGLCGFSIQRLGPNSAQADFDGTPMVTDTMCRRGHPLPGRGAARARRGLHPDHPGDRRHQGRPDVPRQAAPGRGGPAADPRQRRRPQPARTPRSTGAPGLAGQAARTRACRSSPRRPRSAPASPSRSRTGTSTTPARRGARPPPARSRRSRPRCRPRAARARSSRDRGGGPRLFRSSRPAWAARRAS